MDVFHQMHSTVMFIVDDDDNGLVSTLADAAGAAADVAMVSRSFFVFSFQASERRLELLSKRFVFGVGWERRQKS